MTAPIDVTTIHKTLTAANLTTLADEIKPIGKDTLEPVQNANSAWRRLKSSFQVSGLEGVSQMLERPEADAEDFSTSISDAETALRDKFSTFESIENDRPNLVQRVEDANTALSNAQDRAAGVKPDDPNYADVQSDLTTAETTITTLEDDITTFNTRVTDAEQELADALTGITAGTEVQNVGTSTVSKPLTSWDGRVDDMRSLVMSSTDPSFVESIGNSFAGNVQPGDDAGGQALWAADHAGTLTGGTSAWFAYFHHGRFAPRGANGRYTAFKNLSKAEQGKLARTSWKDLRNAHNPKSWSAKPNQSAARAKWLKVGKIAGPIGTALSFATGAYDQWTADEGAGYETDERVGRAATRSALSGGGALAGAALGAKGGALVGSFFGPAGTVVGGIAGGLIGGIIGSGVGNWAADKLVDLGGKIGDKVGDGIDKVGSWVSSGVKKLAFWD